MRPIFQKTGWRGRGRRITGMGRGICPHKLARALVFDFYFWVNSLINSKQNALKWLKNRLIFDLSVCQFCSAILSVRQCYFVSVSLQFCQSVSAILSVRQCYFVSKEKILAFFPIFWIFSLNLDYFFKIFEFGTQFVLHPIEARCFKVLWKIV